MGTSKAGKVCVCAIQSISQEELKVLIFGLILHLSLTEKNVLSLHAGFGCLQSLMRIYI